jgi:hypothetical protein
MWNTFHETRRVYNEHTQKFISIIVDEFFILLKQKIKTGEYHIFINYDDITNEFIKETHEIVFKKITQNGNINYSSHFYLLISNIYKFIFIKLLREILRKRFVLMFNINLNCNDLINLIKNFKDDEFLINKINEFNENYKTLANLEVPPHSNTLHKFFEFPENVTLLKIQIDIISKLLKEFNFSSNRDFFAKSDLYDKILLIINDISFANIFNANEYTLTGIYNKFLNEFTPFIVKKIKKGTFVFPKSLIDAKSTGIQRGNTARKTLKKFIYNNYDVSDNIYEIARSLYIDIFVKHQKNNLHRKMSARLAQSSRSARSTRPNVNKSTAKQLYKNLKSQRRHVSNMHEQKTKTSIKQTSRQTRRKNRSMRTLHR